MRFVRRFSRTERTLHWVNAAGFLLLLATGLILYLPRLSVLDNLQKGASGQALQNMNLALGLEEAAGLA